ncbi:hypothetical protein GTZ99_04100 [Novosphingobium sp. FSY-8]|uniref:DUF2846 domain-containing protein n=1 Tax=Novosphingobium ovatum TaxID=1908523 RepID=A0ABW9XB13_9SPHN|nr:hypothetical protein [Novosphingobium ovatum]NBC35736.1 hypothetical protein [Novosphingobium ovatum]
MPVTPDSATPGRALILPALSPVRMVLLSELSSARNRPGDAFPVRLAAPLVVGGVVVVPAGALGVGEVVEAKRATNGGGPGVLIIAVRYIEQGGRQIRLRSTEAETVGEDRVAQIDRSTTRHSLLAVSPTAAARGMIGAVTKGGEIALGAGSGIIARTMEAVDFTPPPPPVAIEPPHPARRPNGLPMPPRGSGLVVFFRPGSMNWAGIGCTVKEEGQKVSSLGNGRWFAMVARPGLHTFRVTGETTDELRMEVEPDETRFVVCRMRMSALIARPFIRPADEGEFLGQRLKPVDADDMGAAQPHGYALRPDRVPDGPIGPPRP